MNNDVMMNVDSVSMSTLSTTADTEMMELCEEELDTVAGGCGFNLGDFEGFNQSSGNFYSKKNLAMNQATFAGPEGSGTISSVNLEEINSGAFQNIGAQL